MSTQNNIVSFQQTDIQNFCFICGFPSSPNFERVEGGFHQHIKDEHNMWNYLFFMIHLSNKDEDDYTGPESYVKEKLDQTEVRPILFVFRKTALHPHIARLGDNHYPRFKISFDPHGW